MLNQPKIQKVVPVKKNGYMLELQVPAPTSLNSSQNQSNQQDQTLIEEREIISPQEMPQTQEAGGFMRNLFHR